MSSESLWKDLGLVITTLDEASGWPWAASMSRWVMLQVSVEARQQGEYARAGGQDREPLREAADGAPAQCGPGLSRRNPGRPCLDAPRR